MRICCLPELKKKNVANKKFFADIVRYSSNNIQIKEIIWGTGCSGCKALYAAVEAVLKENNICADLKKEEDIVEILKYGVMSLPAIVIDGKVAVQGRKLTKDEIVKILKK